MKSAIKIILICILVSFITITTTYFFNYKVVTVLEITLIENDYGLIHRISYVEQSVFGKNSAYSDFKTSAGIDNFINQFVDIDLSGWETYKFKMEG